MSVEYPAEAFIKRMMRVVETARVVGGGYFQPGVVAVASIASDRCPIPTQGPAGRKIPLSSDLCGEPIEVMLRVEDVSEPSLDLVVLEDDEVRGSLTVYVACDHAKTVKALCRAAVDRLEVRS